MAARSSRRLRRAEPERPGLIADTRAATGRWLLDPHGGSDARSRSGQDSLQTRAQLPADGCSILTEAPTRGAGAARIHCRHARSYRPMAARSSRRLRRAEPERPGLIADTRSATGRWPLDRHGGSDARSRSGQDSLQTRAQLPAHGCSILPEAPTRGAGAARTHCRHALSYRPMAARSSRRLRRAEPERPGLIADTRSATGPWLLDPHGGSDARSRSGQDSLQTRAQLPADGRSILTEAPTRGAGAAWTHCRHALSYRPMAARSSRRLRRAEPERPGLIADTRAATGPWPLDPHGASDARSRSGQD